MGDRPDYSLTAVDVVSRPEWAAKERTDKSFYAAAAATTFGVLTSALYTVPAGKTLYITQFSAAISADLPASGDLNQIAIGSILDVTDEEELLVVGMNGGVGLTLPKPIVVPAGHQVSFGINCRANHDSDVYVSAGGYEV